MKDLLLPARLVRASFSPITSPRFRWEPTRCAHFPDMAEEAPSLPVSTANTRDMDSITLHSIVVEDRNWRPAPRR